LNTEDIAYAVSALFVFYLAITVPINMLVSHVPREVSVALSWILSGIIPSLLVGLIFARKMNSAKLRSIAKVLVVVAALIGLFLPNITGFVDWSIYNAGNPNITMQGNDFMLFMSGQTFTFIALNLMFLMPTMFAGLYIGASLRKS
jgi:hypothetical protein